MGNSKPQEQLFFYHTSLYDTLLFWSNSSVDREYISHHVCPTPCSHWTMNTERAWERKTKIHNIWYISLPKDFLSYSSLPWKIKLGDCTGEKKYKIINWRWGGDHVVLYCSQKGKKWNKMNIKLKRRRQVLRGYPKIS